MMKKVKWIVIAILVLALVIGAVYIINAEFYNRTLIDLTYAYDTAIIQLPDGTIVRGEVESWTDYDNSDQMQVKVNGKTYLVHSADVALIKD